MQGLGSGLLPVNGISPLVPHFISQSSFSFILLRLHSLGLVHCWAGPDSAPQKRTRPAVNSQQGLGDEKTRCKDGTSRHHRC